MNPSTNTNTNTTNNNHPQEPPQPPFPSFKGTCFCGSASFKVDGKPLISVYCHCTLCQRLTGCAFVHGLHYPMRSFTWTHDDPGVVFSNPPTQLHEQQQQQSSQWTLWRCQHCFTFLAAHNQSQNKCSIKSSHFTRTTTTGKIHNWEFIKPTAHIFYETRMLDVVDGLSKWDGYEYESNRLDLG